MCYLHSTKNLALHMKIQQNQTKIYLNPLDLPLESPLVMVLNRENLTPSSLFQIYSSELIFDRIK